jgi:hypothetical protein
MDSGGRLPTVAIENVDFTITVMYSCRTILHRDKRLRIIVQHIEITRTSTNVTIGA